MIDKSFTVNVEAPATKVSNDDHADLQLAVPLLDKAEQNNINPGT